MDLPIAPINSYVTVSQEKVIYFPLMHEISSSQTYTLCITLSESFSSSGVSFLFKLTFALNPIALPNSTHNKIRWALLLFYLNLINASNFILSAKTWLILYWSLFNIFLKCSKKYGSKISTFGNCLGGRKNHFGSQKLLSSEIKYFWADCFPPTVLSMTHYSPK